MKNFRTYQKSVSFYHLTTSLRLPSPLKDQLHRAASSIVLNLAEGSGRSTMADQKRFYHIAFGSLRECQAVLDLAQTSSSTIREAADSLAASLYCLIKSRG